MNKNMILIAVLVVLVVVAVVQAVQHCIPIAIFEGIVGLHQGSPALQFTNNNQGGRLPDVIGSRLEGQS